MGATTTRLEAGSGAQVGEGTGARGRYGELFEYDAESGKLVLGSDPAKVGV